MRTKVCTDKGGGGGGQFLQVYGRFDTKSFRYKYFRYKLKSIRYIPEVGSIHSRSFRFNQNNLPTFEDLVTTINSS